MLQCLCYCLVCQGYLLFWATAHKPNQPLWLLLSQPFSSPVRRAPCLEEHKALCEADNHGVAVSRRGLGSITSCCQPALDFVTGLIVLSRARSLCACGEVLQPGWGELCAHRMCLCMCFLPLRRVAFNCKVNLYCLFGGLHWLLQE